MNIIGIGDIIEVSAISFTVEIVALRSLFVFSLNLQLSRRLLYSHIVICR